jgi:hypothetical protein
MATVAAPTGAFRRDRRPPFVHAATWLAGTAVPLGVLAAAWSRVADAVLARPMVPPAGDPGRFAGVEGVHTSCCATSWRCSPARRAGGPGCARRCAS